MKYKMFRLGRLQWEDCEVIEKKVYNVQGHEKYVLIGLDTCNKRAGINVTRTTWDKFDVPITTSINIKKKKNRYRDYESNKKTFQKSYPIIPPKKRRKNHDENIERWIAEHYGLDYEKLVNDPYKEDF